jgi:ParB family chromosome partitioning protein
MEIFHKSLNPITRANALNRLISMSPTGMTGVARELGIPKSTLSEYLKVLELSPKLQEQVAKGPELGIPFRDALRVARLGLGREMQDSLAETFETEGMEAFRSEVERLSTGGAKRGAPAGLLVVRVVFDHRYKPDVETYKAYIEHCKALGVEPDERCKFLISEDIKRAQTSG